MTCRDSYRAWIAGASQRLRPRTIDSYTRCWRLYLDPIIGDCPFDDLSPDHLQSAIAAIPYPRTAQIVAITARLALRGSPGLVGLSRPRSPAPDHRWWGAEEMQRFFASITDDPFKIAWLLAGMCGMRRGEICGLQWLDLDFDRCTITIRHQISALSGGASLQPPKSRTSERTIPIPRSMIPILSDAYCVHVARSLIGEHCPFILSSPRSKSGAYSPSYIDRQFAIAVERSGLWPISLHGLRHSWASLAIAQGISLPVVQSILGHSSPVVTAAIYVHVSMDSQRAAIDKLGAKIASSRLKQPDS